MSADSPLVEKFGFVLPSRNSPHSGCPYAAHPSGSCESARMSAKPNGSSGQPSASAIGPGMAMTRGVSWNETKSPVIAASPWSPSR